MIRQRAQIAGGAQKLAQSSDFDGIDRAAPQALLALDQGVDLLLVLLGLERAGAVDERAAGCEQRDRAVEQAALQCHERRNLGFAFDPGDVRMASDGSGGHAGCVDEHRVERAAPPFGCIGEDRLGLEPDEPREILL